VDLNIECENDSQNSSSDFEDVDGVNSLSTLYTM
jgi:hypothetical protein